MRLPFQRSVGGPALVEEFLIAAVASILVIRIYLELTGYPQIGGGGLHIAHMLWGGALMMVAVLLLLTTLNEMARRVGSLLGGIGFGTFIDELGKFITSDNDYFYRPTFSILYILFVMLFFLYRYLARPKPLSPNEALANAFDLVREMATGFGTIDDRDKLDELLAKVDPYKPGARELHTIANALKLDPSRQFDRLSRIRHAFLDRVWQLGHSTWFVRLIILFFVLDAFANFAIALDTLGAVFALVPVGIAGGSAIAIVPAIRFGIARALASGGVLLTSAVWLDWTWDGVIAAEQGLNAWGDLLGSGISAMLVFAGIALLGVNRIRAYGLLRASVLVSIFITQVFSFYVYQMLAVVNLSFDLLTLLGISALIESERAQHQTEETASETALAGAR